MGFSKENIGRALEETGGKNSELILETLFKYSSKVKDHFIGMDFPEEMVIKAIQGHGENANVAEIVDFIYAGQMEPQFDEFSAVPVEKEPKLNNKKRRAYNEPPRKGKKLNTSMDNDDNLIRLPNPMIGFGVPNEPGVTTHRPNPIPDIACGPPYFYYENVAKAPKGVRDKISSHLYDIKPEFVDSMYFSAAARKRGYIHNLPIHNRFKIQPPSHLTIQEVFPVSNKWWPTLDKRTKLNCLVTSTPNAQLAKRICESLEKHDGEPPLKVQKEVIKECKRGNMVWVGKNRVVTLESDEMEKLLGFPENHTRGSVSITHRYKSLGNSFQVDTVAYHLSVLKPLFPNGIKVLSLFMGIDGVEVALHQLQIPMKVVVSVEISEENQYILSSFWQQTKQTDVLREFKDVQELDHRTIERLMDEYGGFDLVIGGSPCNNLAGRNRVSRVGLEGKQSSLFFDYSLILETVRPKAEQMSRRVTLKCHQLSNYN